MLELRPEHNPGLERLMAVQVVQTGIWRIAFGLAAEPFRTELSASRECGPFIELT